ncbi:MAG TPA: YezD family protein [Bacillales bacterium]|nr:YezD family protein [Bacillales bacterium]
MGENPDQIDRITEEVSRMLGTLKYGSITLIVQDGKVVQIERNEKMRLR